MKEGIFSLKDVGKFTGGIPVKEKPTFKQKIKKMKREMFVLIILLVLVLYILVKAGVFLGQQEKAELAAKELADTQIPKLMHPPAASLGEAMQRGYYSRAKSSHLEKNTWFVEIEYVVSVLDFPRNMTVNITNNIVLEVNASNYEVKMPRNWK